MLAASLSPFALPSLAAGFGLLILPWLVRLPALSLLLLFISLVAGQTARLPLPGQGGGLLLSDIAVSAVLLTAGLHVLRAPRRPKALGIVWIFVPYLLWSALTLALNVSSLGPLNTLVAAAYWLR